jgi:hypothetical protein
MAQAAEALQDALRRLHIPFDATQFQWQGIVPVAVQGAYGRRARHGLARDYTLQPRTPAVY